METTQPTEPTDPPPVQVKLDRTGALIEVPPDRSILACVADLVPALAGGCEKGVCGRCQVSVLDGNPSTATRCSATPNEPAGQMLLCVSRARGSASPSTCDPRLGDGGVALAEHDDPAVATW